MAAHWLIFIGFKTLFAFLMTSHTLCRLDHVMRTCSSLSFDRGKHRLLGLISFDCTLTHTRPHQTNQKLTSTLLSHFRRFLGIILASFRPSEQTNSGLFAFSFRFPTQLASPWPSWSSSKTNRQTVAKHTDTHTLHQFPPLTMLHIHGYVLSLPTCSTLTHALNIKIILIKTSLMFLDRTFFHNRRSHLHNPIVASKFIFHLADDASNLLFNLHSKRFSSFFRFLLDQTIVHCSGRWPARSLSQTCRHLLPFPYPTFSTGNGINDSTALLATNKLFPPDATIAPAFNEYASTVECIVYRNRNGGFFWSFMSTFHYSPAFVPRTFSKTVVFEPCLSNSSHWFLIEIDLPVHCWLSLCNPTFSG